MTERGYYLMTGRGLSIHREDCPLVGQPTRWHWKGPFGREAAYAFLQGQTPTVVGGIQTCDNTCVERGVEPPEADSRGWAADQAIALAERQFSQPHSAERPLVALQLAWFAVVQTMQDLTGYARTGLGGLHAMSPETVTQPDQPFSQFVEPALLARLRALGEAIDGVKFEDAGSLKDFDGASAIRDARLFVDDAPARFDRMAVPVAGPQPGADRLMAMTSDDGLVTQLVRTDMYSHFAIRRDGDWVPLDDLAVLEDLAFVGTTSRALDVWDSCEAAGLHISIKHFPSSIDGPFWPDPIPIDDDEFIYDEETGEYQRPEGVIEEDLYLHEFLGPDKQSVRLDYKDTLRTDPGTGVQSRSALDSCVKTIAGFLNARGGTLLIGVADDGTVHGIEGDYASRPNPDKELRDWFEEHVHVAVSISMTDEAASLVRTQIHHVRGRDICRVQVAPSAVPVHAEIPVPRPGEPGQQQFFVRIGRGTRPLAPGDQEQYIAQRWSD